MNKNNITTYDKCILCETLNTIAKKWTLLIILEISKSEKNTLQYSKIKKQLPQITSKILSSRLKELKKNKIITKQTENTKIPINTYYQLTPKGKELLKIINEIKLWGTKWKNYNFNKCIQQNQCQKCK